MKKYSFLILGVFSFVLFTASFVQSVSAKSVSWSDTAPKSFGYCWNNSREEVNDGDCEGWVAALENPNVTITYAADIYNADTNALISDGATIPTGTRIRFQPKGYADSDISWFGTGHSSDSPNGHWVSNAGRLARACEAQDYVGTVNVTRVMDVYIPLSVNPPSTNVSLTGSTAGLSNQGGNVYRVDSPGSIVARVNFDSTYAKYYYRYFDHGIPPSIASGCFGNNHPLKTGTVADMCFSFGFGPGLCLKGISGETDYTLSVPAQNIPFNLTVVSGNNPPNPPTITGPNTGMVSSPYTFNFTATDPDGDQVKYYVDWDNNGSIDQGNPYDNLVNSGQSVAMDHTWITAGTYTFQALTQDSKGANSGWAQYTITVNAGPPAPTANLTINGSDGPLNVVSGTALNLSWTSANATSCTAWGAGWGAGGAVAITGTSSTTANASDTYILSCTNGTTTVTDSVQVNLTNSLKVCENSCSSGRLRGDVNSTRSFTLAQGGSQNLVACWNASADCSNGSGNVTSSATWNENSGSNVVSLSGSDPKAVTANSSGTEGISASYSGQTNNINVTVTCLPTIDCSNAPGRENHCANETYNVDNGCGVSIVCNGTKTCNYNWKEVSP